MRLTLNVASARRRMLFSLDSLRYTAFRYAEFANPKTRTEKEGIMSKAMSYVAVGVAAFLAGGFSFRLVDRSGQSKAQSKSVDGRASSGEATVAVPREFVIEGMSCQGCADSITSAPVQIPGVQSANVSLVDKRRKAQRARPSGGTPQTVATK
jgi:copper chaperone CopZ